MAKYLDFNLKYPISTYFPKNCFKEIRYKYVWELQPLVPSNVTMLLLPYTGKDCLKTSHYDLHWEKMEV